MQVGKFVGYLIVAVFGLIGAIHIYWGLGGYYPVEATIPHIDGKPRFIPTKTAIWMVVVALIAGILIVLGRLEIWGANLPAWIFKSGIWAIFIVFLLRSIGNFWFYGLFKRIIDTKFAYWDTRLYVPFCLLMAFLTLIVAMIKYKSN